MYALQYADHEYRREFAYSSLHKSIKIWCELLLALSAILGLDQCSSIGKTARFADLRIRRHFSFKDNANISTTWTWSNVVIANVERNNVDCLSFVTRGQGRRFVTVHL